MLAKLAIKKFAGKISFPLQCALILFAALSLSACGGGGGPGGGGPAAGSSSSTSPTVLTFNSSISYPAVMRAYQGVNYYKIVGLIAGEDYRVTITSSVGIGFNGYRNPDFASGFECGPSSSSTCTANTNGDLYLMAWSTSGPVADSSYTLSVISTISEGSPSAPKDLTTLLPYSATLTAPQTKSFFVVTGLTPGNSYSVNLDTGSDVSIDLRVFQDAFQAEACTALINTSAKSCTVTAATSQLWFTVKGTGNVILSLTDNALPLITYANEGTILTPILVSYSVDGLVSSGQVGRTDSYYNLAGLKPNTGYRVVLKNMLDDVDLFSYPDSTFTTSTCSAVKTTELCLETSSLTGDIWFSVSGVKAYQYLGASYDIYVYEYFPDEGTYSSRKILNYSEPLIYNGTADNYSYYQVTGMTPNTTYLIDVSNFTGPVEVYAISVNYTAFSSCNGREEVSGSGVLRCLVTSGDTGVIDLRVREGVYLTGTAFTAQISLSPYQSEGTKASPVVLTTGLAQAGAIGGVPSYYRIDGLTADTAYTVTVSGMNSAHDFYIYQDGANPNLWSSVSGNYDCTGDMTRTSCTRRTIGTSMWLMVGKYYPLNGAALTIDVVQSAYQAEGALATPIPLTFGSADFPYSGATDASQSYYAINGLTAGTEYVISLSNVATNDYVRQYVYDNFALLGSITFGDYVCNTTAYNVGSTFCRITPTGSSVWVMADGADTGQGAFYELNATLAPVAETLTIDASVAGTFPRASSTNETSSQYTLTNLDPAQLYIVTLDKHQADVDLRVSRTGFTGFNCDLQVGTVTEQCTSLPSAAGELFVEVAGDKTLYGTVFELGVIQGPSDEGTAVAPIDVVHTAGIVTTRSSSVGISGSYYKITGLDADRMYEVSMIAPTNNIRMEVATNSTYVSFQCASDKLGFADEFCAVNADTSGVLYVGVDGKAKGAEFTLQVKDGLLADGSSTVPVTVNYTGVLTTLSGQVDKGISYYEVTGLDPNVSYTISLLGPSDDVSLSVSSDAAYSTQVCASFTAGIVDESCNATTPNGGPSGSAKLYIEVFGTSTRAGATYTLQVQ